MIRLRAGALALGLLSAAAVAADDPFAGARQELIENVIAAIRVTSTITGTDTLDPRLIEAMSKVPRHAFVPEPLQPYAYINRPLPVGRGQTESQPYIVALMTELARVERGASVLLVGIGGGWHAAILAELGAKVRVVELDAEIERAAVERLKARGYRNVETRVADPYFGWGNAQFDAIIVRHAIKEVPAPLLKQLKPGGRMVLPVERSRDDQALTLVTKDGEGRARQRAIMPVMFNRLPGGERI